MKKYINLVLALILALGTLAATAILTINMLSLSDIREFTGYKPYMLMVIYSEAPLCFVCAYIAQRIFRLNPVFFAMVFVLLKTIIRLITIYFIAYSIHFWVESVLSLVLAILGSCIASQVNEKENMSRAIHPALAAGAAIMIPLFSWLVTLALCQLR